MVVAKELQRRSAPVLAGPVLAVREEQVLPAVSVVIDERNARAERFRKILFAEGTGVMHKRETRGFGDVGELDGRLAALSEYRNRGQNQSCDQRLHFNTAEACSCIACRSLLSSGWLIL